MVWVPSRAPKPSTGVHTLTPSKYAVRLFGSEGQTHGFGVNINSVQPGGGLQLWITDSGERADVMGSAWRWTSRQASSSRRKMLVTRRETGVRSSRPPIFAVKCSAYTKYAMSGVTSLAIKSKPTASPSR